MIGRFGAIDGSAEKYHDISPYAYAANNPLKYIDPDGNDIRLASHTRSDGTTVVQMSVTGKLINQSSINFSSYDMANYASRLGNAIKDYYGIQEKGFEVQVSVDIEGVSSGDSFMKPLSESDHAFYLRDDGNLADPDNPGGVRPYGVLGVAAFGEKAVYMSKDVVGDKPADEGKYKGTGLSAKSGATLERTGSHELGHSAGNTHPDKGTMPGNLIHQSGKTEAGTKITREQVMDMLKRYEEGKLNNGRQNY